MKLKDIYNSKKPVISFEVSPPKGEGLELKERTNNLIDELKIMKEFNPSFISITYGAGGSNQDRGLDLISRIKTELNLTPIPHFTCVGGTRHSIFEYLKILQNENIENIFALRGDPPKGETEFKKPVDGFGYANELVEFIKENTNLGIAVAGYPEKHLECDTFKNDILNLKRKVDAGADIVITQLFFDNNFYFNFVEKTVAAGINVSIIPGILPITNLAQVEKMTSMCGAKIPDDLRKQLYKFQDDKQAVKQIGFEHAVSQCKELLLNNVNGIHFYPLNKSYMVSRILNELNINDSLNCIN